MAIIDGAVVIVNPDGTPVPQINRVANIGEKTDFISVPYQYGSNSLLAYAVTGYYHIHGESFLYPKYSDDITLTSGAGAYNTFGAITEIIPKDTLKNQAGNLRAFDIHWCNVSNISAEGKYIIDFYAGDSGSEVLINSTGPVRGSAFSQELPRRIQIPQQPAGTRISAKLTSSNAEANTVQISFEGHFYG